jgi:hypothetical protein
MGNHNSDNQFPDRRISGPRPETTTATRRKKPGRSPRVLVPRQTPINSWTDAKSLQPQIPYRELLWVNSVAASVDAVTYVPDTGMTVEQIRNSVYCPKCGADQTDKCRYAAHGEPVARAKTELHRERINAAVERFGSGKRPNDTGDCR